MRAGIAIAIALAVLAAACTSSTGETSPTLPEVIPTLTQTTEAVSEEPEEPAEPEVPAGAEEDYLWAVGDCVDLGTSAEFDLPYAPYGTELLVDCESPHTHQVYFTARLPEGPDAPFPDELNTRLWDICFFQFGEVMGLSASDSKLDLTLYLPDEDEWAAGERYHACVAHQPGLDVVFEHLVGFAPDDPAAFLWDAPPGTCYDIFDPGLLAVAEPVPCEQQHFYEAIGEAGLGDPEDDFPGADALDGLAVEACDALFLEYAVDAFDEEVVLTFPVPIVWTEGEWDTGKRTARCFAFAGTPEEGLLIVSGSLGDGTFEIIGTEPDDGVSA